MRLAGRPPHTPCLRESAAAARESPRASGIRAAIMACSGTVYPHVPGLTPGNQKIMSRGGARAGWQHEAASRVERHFRDAQVFVDMEGPRTALVRLQGGPGAGLEFTSYRTNFLTTFSPQLFRVLLLRRLGLPLPLTARTCRCARPLDPCGHHRAACPRAGVLGRRGHALESVLSRICREAGGRATT